MAESEIVGPSGDFKDLNSWPVPALQALYKAVTGKTDNYSKAFKKHVVINYDDIYVLHQKITQLIAHYKVVAPPTVTIVVKQYKGSTVQYNSFSKFVDSQANLLEITSEVHYKYEFLIEPPDSPSPQRYIVNIGLDSGLPMIADRPNDIGGADNSYFDYILYSELAESLKISVDYIDFLFARHFVSVVEEWFDGLDSAPRAKFAAALLRRVDTVSTIVNQFGRIGLATFIAVYAWRHNGNVGTFGELAYAASVAITLWTIIAVIISESVKVFNRRVFRAQIPSAIILNPSDRKTFDKAVNDSKRLNAAIASIVFTSVSSIVLNLVASIIYSSLK